jgi:hypothetical protein
MTICFISPLDKMEKSQDLGSSLVCMFPYGRQAERMTVFVA